MNQNLKIPFTNQRLLTSILTPSSFNQEFKLSENCKNSSPSVISKQIATTDTQTKNVLSETYNSLLNYSDSTCNLEDNYTPHFSRLKEEEGSFQMEENNNNRELLQSLLFDTQANNQGQSESKQSNQPFKQNKMIEKNIQNENEQTNELTDYSNELKTLKQTIVQIQRFAQLEITRLKQQLEHQKKMRRQQKQSKNGQRAYFSTVQVGVNTEYDFRDDEISILKESVLQHINLNRQLLRKQIKNNSKVRLNVQEIMNRVKI